MLENEEFSCSRKGYYMTDFKKIQSEPRRNRHSNYAVRPRRWKKTVAVFAEEDKLGAAPI